jgi:hypothetical protein
MGHLPQRDRQMRLRWSRHRTSLRLLYRSDQAHLSVMRKQCGHGAIDRRMTSTKVIALGVADLRGDIQQE